MSASLVGSEMCIRDRAWSSRVADSCPAAHSDAPGRRRAPGHDADGGFVPVSYTHLTLPTICSV
eukprot:5963898-Alexandrium_andersonii.AAC.1